MTLDIGNTDRLNIFRQEAQRLGVKVLPPDINRSRSGVRLRCRGRHRVLRAGRGEGRGPPGDGPCGRGARRGRTVQDRSPISPAAWTRGWSTSAPSRIWRGPAPSTASSHNRRQLVENSDRILGGAAGGPARARKRPGRRCSAAAGRDRGAAADRQCPTGRRMNGWARNSPPWAFISPAIRSMPMARR